MLAREEMYVGSGTPFQLRTGYLFELDQHPRAALNKKYLATRLEHHGIQTQSISPEIAALLAVDTKESYRVEVLESTDAALPYRVPCITPWPRISGQEMALIDGPADGDPYAQIDDDGRYLLTFKFDENTHDDGKASTRVRMMQPHGGSVEGFHFNLRKGTEVMITFVGGDPDRPMITGVVPNALKPSVVGKRNRSQNIIRTGSKNQIVMEDEQGKEFIFISTPNKATGIYMGYPSGPQSKVYTGEDEKFNHPDCASPSGGETTTTANMSFYKRRTETTDSSSRTAARSSTSRALRTFSSRTR